VSYFFFFAASTASLRASSIHADMPAILRLAEALAEKGTLDGAAIDAIVEQYGPPKQDPLRRR
jgi:hypothetical protein